MSRPWCRHSPTFARFETLGLSAAHLKRPTWVRSKVALVRRGRRTGRQGTSSSSGAVRRADVLRPARDIAYLHALNCPVVLLAAQVQDDLFLNMVRVVDDDSGL